MLGSLESLVAGVARCWVRDLLAWLFAERRHLVDECVKRKGQIA